MTTHDLIAKFGGPTALGTRLGVPPKTVSMWGTRDSIPADHHLAVWRLAIEAGVDWSPPGADGVSLVNVED